MGMHSFCLIFGIYFVSIWGKSPKSNGFHRNCTEVVTIAALKHSHGHSLVLIFFVAQQRYSAAFPGCLLCNTGMGSVDQTACAYTRRKQAGHEC